MPGASPPPTTRTPRGIGWRRWDTLGLRLFVLMWVTLVGSHLVAYTVAFPLGLSVGPGPGPGAGAPPPSVQGGPDGPGAPPPADGPRGPRPPHGAPPEGRPLDRLQPANLPPLPSLPPGTLPAQVLWLDYLLRGLVIALGAAIGARWLARPMQRLAQAAQQLSHGLARGAGVAPLNEAQGTAEVRDTAAVFNAMATRLQEQFDARGMHLAAVSHDLRTPLPRLRLRLEDAPPALADAAAGDIAEMGELIDSTLEVLHEMHEGTPADVVDVPSLAAALADDMAAQGHDVVCTTPADGAQAPAMHRVRCRPIALKRVLANLVGNALRYGGSARMSAQAEGDGVVITVDDQGPGIPEDQLERAFRPWVRLAGDAAAAHARSGHGLGLAIARELAERDGGRLTLANRAEGGLRATLWLPAAEQLVPGATTVSVSTNSG